MDTDSFLQTLNNITFITPTIGVIAVIILTLILLVVSGLASGSEIAFFSLSPKDLANLDPEHSVTDEKIEQFRNDSERTLATILIANNLVNVTIIMLCNYIFSNTIDFGDAELLRFLCLTVLLTFILLLFGEILPKVYSRQNPLAFCRRMSGFIGFARKLFWPLESVLISTGILAGKVLQKDSHVLSVDELEQALEMTDKKELKGEESILQSIVHFGDETVREVMTSRQDMVDLEIRTPFADVLKCVVENNYSRIPVYQGNEDNIRGILYIKDILPYITKPASFRWQSLMRPPYFVPETKKIDDLLKDFQENKVHIAVVVDEFGGTSGIVTLEDLVEEIFGDIEDEHDNTTYIAKKVDESDYVLSARLEIEKVNEKFDLELPENDEYLTIGGLILHQYQSFPKLHELITIGKYQFKILKVTNTKIELVRLKVLK